MNKFTVTKSSYLYNSELSESLSLESEETLFVLHTDNGERAVFFGAEISG